MHRYLIYFIEQVIIAIVGISIGCFIVTHKLKFLAIAAFGFIVICAHFVYAVSIACYVLKNKNNKNGQN